MNEPRKNQEYTRWWDALSAVLLLSLIITAVSRLVVTRWTEDFNLVANLAVLGAVLGIAIGQSRFSARVSALLAFLYGITLIPWQLLTLIEVELELKDSLMVLGRRIGETIWVLIHSQPVTDNIFFLTIMGLLFFFLSVHAGYTLTRYASPWRVVLPLGLVIVTVHSYDYYLTRRALFLAAYLLFGLILVARLTYLRNRHEWTLNRTKIPTDAGFDWIRFTLAIVIIITLLAWTAPALAGAVPSAGRAWSVITRPWREFQDNVSNAFSSLQSSVGVVNDFYGDSLSLGKGSALTEMPVLDIQGPRRAINVGRYYWRAYTYDTYEGGRWRSTLNENIETTPDSFEVPLPELQSRQEMTFTVTPLISIATLYTPEQPLWVSVPAQAYYGTDQDGNMDLAAFQALPSVNADESYEVRSTVSTVSEDELRSSETEYPQWITDKYLQLPDNLTSRTRQLAQELAEGKDNPYDIAKAVTAYLRRYEYSPVIDTPPARREMIDWWLFDYQKGFCQYYASAEILLLRSLGIPARMAVGYAEGEFIPDGALESLGDRDRFLEAENGSYLVRQRDAHAWPEVYFPGYGWVEFEPTASQLAITRPSSPDGSSSSDFNPSLLRTPNLELEKELPELPARSSETQVPSASMLLVSIAYMLGAVLLALVVFLVYTQRAKLQSGLLAIPIRMDRGFQKIGIKTPIFLKRWANYASLSPVERSYLEINQALRRLGQPPEDWRTPAERAGSLGDLIPSLKPYVAVLLAEYEHSIYSLIPPNRVQAQTAGAQVRTQSYKALAQKLLAVFFGSREKNRPVVKMP